MNCSCIIVFGVSRWSNCKNIFPLSDSEKLNEYGFCNLGKSQCKVGAGYVTIHVAMAAMQYYQVQICDDWWISWQFYDDTPQYLSKKMVENASQREKYSTFLSVPPLLLSMPMCCQMDNNLLLKNSRGKQLFPLPANRSKWKKHEAINKQLHFMFSVVLWSLGNISF